MNTILDVVVPIFGLIAVGAAVARAGLLTKATGDELSRFVFLVAVPCLLFRTLATSGFGEISPFRVWLPYFGVVAVIWALSSVIARGLYARDRRTAVIAGMSASYVNAVFVSLPIVQRAYGDEGLRPLLVIMAVHLPVMMLATTLLMERASFGDRREAEGEGAARPAIGAILVQLLRNLSRNALMLAILAGLAWRATGLPVERHLDELLRLLGGTAAPVALFALGMSLVRFGLSGDLRLAALIAALSLLLMPGLVLLAGQATGLPPLYLKALVVTAASPAGINAFLFANHFGSGEKLATTTVLLSTILSVVSLTFWLLVLG